MAETLLSSWRIVAAPVRDLRCCCVVDTTAQMRVGGDPRPARPPLHSHLVEVGEQVVYQLAERHGGQLRPEPASGGRSEGRYETRPIRKMI